MRTKVGKDAEMHVAQLLCELGWWVVNVGKPVDIIAMNPRGKTYIFDVKHVMRGDKFYFTRIEANQRESLWHLWRNHDIEDEQVGFVVVFDNKDLMFLTLNKINELEFEGKNHATKGDMIDVYEIICSE